MPSRQQLSLQLADTLDDYGYSEKRVQERIWVNDKASVAKTLSTREIVSSSQVDKFQVGSLREGISLCGESDSDWMQINTSVVCTDKLRNIKNGRNGRVIFRMDRKHAPAGYTYLRCKKQDKNAHPYFDSLQHALVETSKGTFLSSTKYMDVNEDVFYNSPGCIGRNTIYKERQGPSIPKFVKQPKYIERLMDQFGICRDMDFVRGFQCYCPSALNNWLHRRRFTSWPSKQTQSEISMLPYHVVPAGLVGSQHEDLQWRISFTLGEICLIRSFNETQRKMHISLRVLARHVLKSVAPDVSSYMMKNVAFWMAEKTQPYKFTKDQLLDRVMDALDYLLNCVIRKRLPNYMTPKRNLFTGKFQGNQRKQLIKKLKELMDNGHVELFSVLQCQRLNEEFPNVYEILTKAQCVNYNDKLQTLCMFPYCPCSLARFFTFAFFCQYGFVLRFITFFLFLQNCIPMFGTACLSDPMSIDLTKKQNETKIMWFIYRILARSKNKNKLLLKLKPCGWFLSKVLNFFGSRVTNDKRIHML